MNKKVNTLLFVLGATLFNVLVTVLAFFLLLLIYTNFIQRLLPEGAQMWAFSLIVIAAMAIAFVVYRYSLRFVLKKIDMDKYFDPLFVSKQRKQ